jgi:hypothetical protein
MRPLFNRRQTFLYAVLTSPASCCTARVAAKRASVSGPVLDASGAAVKDAKIELIRGSTQVRLTTTGRQDIAIEPARRHIDGRLACAGRINHRKTVEER